MQKLNKKTIFSIYNERIKPFIVNIKIKFKIASIIDNKNIFIYSRNYISFNSACITAGNYFYKVALDSKNTISDEYNNYLMLKKSLPQETILPNLVFNNDKSPYLKMEILNPLKEVEYTDALIFVYSILNKYAEVRSTIIEHQTNIKSALAFLKTIINIDKINTLEIWVQKVLNKKLSIGICHGDLYLKNVMKDDEGNYKLVDFDCVNENGIQDLDVFNYMIEIELLGGKSSWRDQLQSFYENLYESENYKPYVDLIKMNKIEVIVLYYLNRVGLNFKFYDPSEDSLMWMNYSVIDYFLEKIKDDSY